MTPPPERDAAQVIAALVKSQAGLDLPVRLRLWDGSEAGPAGGPVLVIRSPRALQRIAWRPGELGLARAYISGDLEVAGDLTEGLRQVLGTRPRVSLARLAPAALAAIRAVAQLQIPVWPPPAPPGGELHVRGRLHSRARVTAVTLSREQGGYVTTIRAWLDNFEHNLPAISELLTPEQVRVWRLYLAGGALSFEHGRMGVDQILAVRQAR